MRAKRSKRYRKLMHQYELTFGFREPYQVLVDSNLLHAVHSFKMDLIPALERTLQGKVKPLLTKCSLAAIMASQPINPKTNNPFRPHHLPPPTTLPLRHCSHNEDSTPIDEVSCLLSLLSPNAEARKNKEHYILATADPPAPAKTNTDDNSGNKKRKRSEAEIQAEEALRRAQLIRRGARSIPGVPIVYVKRSVMVLEPMSAPSENVRESVEKGKFRAGLDEQSALGKRKRGGEEEEGKKKRKGLKKAKGPNPLSVKKPKKRDGPSGSAKTSSVKEQEPWERHDGGEMNVDTQGVEVTGGENEDSASAAVKPKRKRRHHKSARREGDAGTADGETDVADAE